MAHADGAINTKPVELSPSERPSYGELIDR